MGADLLDRLLVTLAVRLRSFSVCTIQRGWRLGFSPFEAITVHYVLRGTGSLRVGQGPWRSFAPHTIIVVPARHPHSLGAAEDCVGEVRAEDHCFFHGDGLIAFTAGDGSPDALFVCGQIADTHTGAMGLFELFQAPMVETFPADPALRYAFELMLAEVTSSDLATQAMTEVLMKQCLIILLRRHLAASDFTFPILAALQDPKLARAVLAVLEQPGAHYSVDGLAAIAGMGWTSFAEAFAAAFGQGPMEFVQRVRLRIASRLLSGTDLPVKVIAATVGYASRSAFSKAFEVEFGTVPSQFRLVGGMDEGEPERIEGEPPDTEPTSSRHDAERPRLGAPSFGSRARAFDRAEPSEPSKLGGLGHVQWVRTKGDRSPVVPALPPRGTIMVDASDFYLRYSPDVETVADDEAETAQGLMETMRSVSEKTLADSGHAIRSVHAKSHGFLEGELEVASGLPPMLAQGLFSKAATYPVVMRLSTLPGDLLDDSVSPPRGLAVKIIGVEGERLEGSEGDATQDFVLVNGPAFGAPTPKAFLATLKLLAATTDKAERFKKVVSGAMRGVQEIIVATTGGPNATVATMGGQPETHILGETFYSQVPVRFGAYVAKLSVVPFAPELTALTNKPLAEDGGPNAIREAVVEFFRTNGGLWEVRAQLCTSLDDMPVENAATVWPEDKSLYQTVALIRVKPQTAWSEARSSAVDDGLSFSPWHGLAAHRPLGGIMRSRKQAYQMGKRFRAERNGHTIAEPREAINLP